LAVIVLLALAAFFGSAAVIWLRDLRVFGGSQDAPTLVYVGLGSVAAVVALVAAVLAVLLLRDGASRR
jgi:hypothetical protein